MNYRLTKSALIFYSWNFKYVNEVVIGAPYTVTTDLMNHFKVSVVCHGQTDLPLENGVHDPYAVPKMMGKFISVDSGKEYSCELSTILSSL